jgi:penicillin-binding protein 1C
MRWIRAIRVFAGTVIAVAALLWLGWLLMPKPDLYPSDLGFSQVVRDRDGRVLHLTLAPDGRYRLPVKLGEVAPDLINATLAKEDRRYFSHRGVDLRSALRAAWGVLTGQRLGGGSTVTMQYARLRWELQTRSWWGKAVQAFRAVQLERHYDKSELLEAYFTLAPYGGNVEGVAAASLLWCGKSAADVNPREAVALSVIPQSPAARRPRDTPNLQLAAAQAQLYARLHGQISATDEAFTLYPAKIPRSAPHLSRQLLPQAGNVQATVEASRQEALETTITAFLAQERRRGLRNASAILVHAPTREVRAYVGSADFLDEEIHGQVDGVTARRSTGSTLKPFIYALALDAGIIHPGTLLDDAPRSYSSYNPENSDRQFLGPLPASEALRRSRNLPAIDLLSKLPGGGLDTFLRASNVPLRRGPGEYGLSLALGGAEVSLEDLARLYCALATDGAVRDLRYTTSDQPSAAPARLSPAACWLTLDALRDRHSANPRMAWKTGTSHGFRDAWACGVLGEWVIGVWIGHFDNTPMHGLFARETAAPLMFAAIDALGLKGEATPRPSTVVQTKCCSDSGMLASPLCPHQRSAPFIAGVSPIHVCDVHRAIFVDEQGRQTSAGNAQARRIVAEFWPPHRLQQFRQAGLPRNEPPPCADGFSIVTPHSAPKIVSPQSTLVYLVEDAKGAARTIPLTAHVSSGARRLHWFAGAQYLGSSSPDRPLLWNATPGKWVIQVTDDSGQSAKVNVSVLRAGS